MPIRLFAAAAAFVAALGLTAPALASTPDLHGGAAAPNARSTVPAKKSTTFAGYSINAKEGNSDIKGRPSWHWTDGISRCFATLFSRGV